MKSIMCLFCLEYFHFTHHIFVFMILLSSYCSPSDCAAVSLTSQNFDGVIAQNQLVFLNFYADWCRFSQLLAPIFDETADKINEEFTTPGQVLLGRVDCDKETTISGRFHVSKYPTLKFIQNGKALKKEYRGKRSVEAFTNHIRSLLSDPIVYIQSSADWEKVQEKKSGVVAQFGALSNDSYLNLRKVAFDLRDECQFYVRFKEPSETPGDAITFKPTNTKVGERDEGYIGSLTSVDELTAWAQHRCVPLVREITFDNAEELTEEGLPFLILFHHPDDKSSINLYNKVINEELLGEKESMTFLTADGVKFSHPLHHLGKSQNDLPLIAIDSFRHMYMFKDFREINILGRLKQFIHDLHSGKLHREFHYGPDPTEISDPTNQPTQPPESTFRKLGPSPNRYTLLERDEL